nr:hypothetical protein GW17_00056286 [Ipomoea batatas]
MISSSSSLLSLSLSAIAASNATMVSSSSPSSLSGLPFFPLRKHAAILVGSGKPGRRWHDHDPSIFFRDRERLGAREEDGSFGSWRALISGGFVIDGNGDKATSPVQRWQNDGEHLSLFSGVGSSDGITLLSPMFFTQQHEQSSDGFPEEPEPAASHERAQPAMEAEAKEQQGGDQEEGVYMPEEELRSP